MKTLILFSAIILTAQFSFAHAGFSTEDSTEIPIISVDPGPGPVTAAQKLIIELRTKIINLMVTGDDKFIKTAEQIAAKMEIIEKAISAIKASKGNAEAEAHEVERLTRLLNDFRSN